MWACSLVNQTLFCEHTCTVHETMYVPWLLWVAVRLLVHVLFVLSSSISSCLIVSTLISGSSLLLCPSSPLHCISYTCTLYPPAPPTVKQSSTDSDSSPPPLVLRDMLKRYVCASLSNSTAQPSASEPAVKEQEAQIPESDSLWIVSTIVWESVKSVHVGSTLHEIWIDTLQYWVTDSGSSYPHTAASES